MARVLSLVALGAAALAANGDGPSATVYLPPAPGFTNATVTGASVVGAESGRTTLALCVPEGGGRCPVTVTQEKSTQSFHFGMNFAGIYYPDLDCTHQPKQETAVCYGNATVAVPITAGAEKLAANPDATATSSSGGEGRNNNSAAATGSREPVSSSTSGNAARPVTTHSAVLAAVAAAIGGALIL